MHKRQDSCDEVRTSRAKGLYQYNCGFTAGWALGHSSVIHWAAAKTTCNSYSPRPLVLLPLRCRFLHPWALSLQLAVEHLCGTTSVELSQQK